MYDSLYFTIARKARGPRVGRTGFLVLISTTVLVTAELAIGRQLGIVHLRNEKIADVKPNSTNACLGL
jgi:hypothetical protein